MDRRAIIAALLLCGAGCGGSARRDEGPVVLRVSAVHGLSKFAIGTETSGSTAYALSLVYDELPEHVEVVSQKGPRVILRRRSTSPYSAEVLAAALRFDGLISARARGEEIDCELADAATAQAFVQVPAGFDLGPVTLAEQGPGYIRLVARVPLAIDAIEIVELDGSEEWRRLLGHQLDVIPAAPGLYRDQFDGMTSVRTLDLPSTSTLTLFFNATDPALAAAPVRRAVVAALDLAAVARIACGSAACEPSWWTSAPTDSAAPLPARLRLVVLDSEPFPLAAGVVRHQLRAHGVEVDLALLDIDQIREQCHAGQFQLALLALPASHDGTVAMLANPENIARYHSDDFDRAVAAGDLAEAGRILAADAPVLPLYDQHPFAAVDSRFCGGHPDDPSSWRWLVELYPCAEGER